MTIDWLQIFKAPSCISMCSVKLQHTFWDHPLPSSMRELCERIYDHIVNVNPIYESWTLSLVLLFFPSLELWRMKRGSFSFQLCSPKNIRQWLKYDGLKWRPIVTHYSIASLLKYQPTHRQQKLCMASLVVG